MQCYLLTFCETYVWNYRLAHRPVRWSAEGNNQPLLPAAHFCGSACLMPIQPFTRWAIAAYHSNCPSVGLWRRSPAKNVHQAGTELHPLCAGHRLFGFYRIETVQMICVIVQQSHTAAAHCIVWLACGRSYTVTHHFQPLTTSSAAGNGTRAGR